MLYESSIKMRWDRLPEGDDDLASALYKEVDRVYDETSEREQRIYDACALYGDMSLFSGMGYSEDILFEDTRMRHNVIATAVDALTAEVTQSTVRPMAITIGGTFDQRKKAEKLTQYFESQWDLLNIHEVFRTATRDSIVCGLGVVRVGHANEVDAKNDRPVVERIFPANLLMDDFGSSDVMPREFFIRRTPAKEQMVALFPDAEEEIMSSENRRSVFWAHPEKVETHCEVIEAFHLASAPGRKDGRRTLAVRGKVLVDERHERWRVEDTPYKIIRGVPGMVGYWGEQLVMRAAPAQDELNKLLRRIQDAMHLISVPRIFVNRQAEILDGHLTNDVGIVVEYDGNTPPIFHAPQSMSNDVFQHVQMLEQWVYKEMGISELSAVSAKPSGLDSGAALRTYSDVQTRRWINFVRSYERANEEVARELVRVETDIAKGYPGHQVSAFYKDRYESFKWREIELDPERFAVRIFSASALPNTPAGRLQALEEMVKTGVIDRQTFIKLADIPDLQSVRRLVLAGDELLEQMFSRMLEEDKFYEPPDPGLDLNKAVVLATMSAYRGILDGAPEDRVEKLFQFVDECNAMLQAAQEPVIPEEPAGVTNQAAMMAPPLEGVPQAPGMDAEMAEMLGGAENLGAGQVTQPQGEAAPFGNL